ncbi:MAG: tRNA (adenosine(37)-N6)-threonylcarbamoyltransferase complex dimerization subunit type 1 TsaB [Hyphomicrobiales bacterium]|nr:tRNA (adenosine(37)-N6)-threonylcarbamoyltransferase complex dimerization subunit type 1 TsaB [Hyphomicrobiales bacterium]
MRILALDTALAAASACVFDGASGEMLASETLPMNRGQDQAILPLIDRVVRASGQGSSTLDRVAVTVGPGSFTGIRIGISAARAIGLALDAPVVGVSTLAAYAAPLVLEKSEGVVAAGIDARHGRVFVAAFASGQPVVAPRCCAPREAVRAMGAGPLWLTGPASPVLGLEALAMGLEAEIVGNPSYPDIVYVARLGIAADPQIALARPSYLRSPDVKPPPAPVPGGR